MSSDPRDPIEPDGGDRPIFGAPPPGTVCRQRRAAYAVIGRHDGRVAVIREFVRGQEFCWLPGGGLEAGETPAEAIHRETREELGRDCRLHGSFARARQFFLAKDLDRWIDMEAEFARARLEGTIDVPGSHALAWTDPEDPTPPFFHECHAWAARRGVSTELTLRAYGHEGPTVLLLHGGPAAAGYMAPVARALADRYRVVEPFQRTGGDEPLTVARHVADLQQVLERRCGEHRPAVVGHSWGAMLALAHAALHSDEVQALVLICSGTFDLASRQRMHAILEARTDDQLQRRLAQLETEIADPSARRLRAAELTRPIYSHDLIEAPAEEEQFDLQAHRETWADMIRLQEAGVYPAAFTSIRCPVLMLHGADDPHPGTMIRDQLRAVLPQLEYQEWTRCGHYPWLERAVREEFLATLRRRLEELTSPST